MPHKQLIAIAVLIVLALYPATTSATSISMPSTYKLAAPTFFPVPVDATLAASHNGASHQRASDNTTISWMHTVEQTWRAEQSIYRSA